MPPKESAGTAMGTSAEEKTQLLNDHHDNRVNNGYGTSAAEKNTNVDIPNDHDNTNDSTKATTKQKSSSSSKHQSWLLPFYFNIFFACASFSIVMPSLAPYLDRMDAPLTFLPYVVSAYAVGEMIGSILFGYYYEWSVKALALGVGPKSSMISCIIVGMIGSLGYVLADIQSSPQIVLWSRFVQGLWTGGQQTIEQAYLSAAVSSDERTEYTATLSTFAVLGFVIGPSFGALCSNVYIEMDGGTWAIDAYNAPGLFIFIINCFMLVNTAFFFGGMDDKTALVDKSKQSSGSLSALEQTENKTGESATATISAGENTHIDIEENSSTSPQQEDTHRRNYIGLSICILLFFVHYYSFAVQETIITPWVIHDYNWDPLRVNLLFVGAGILSLIASVIVKYASRVLDDRILLLFSALIGFVGSILLIDYPTGEENENPSLVTGTVMDGYTTENNDNNKQNVVPISQFLVGFSLITLAFPFGRNVTLGVYGNVLGPINQGRWMGLMLAVSAVPRALGPFVAVSLLEKANWYTYTEFGLAALLFGVGCLLNLLFWKRLISFEEEQVQQQENQGDDESIIHHSPMPHNSPAIRRHRSLSIKRGYSSIEYDG